MAENQPVFQFKLHVNNILNTGHYSIPSLTSMRSSSFYGRQLLMAYTTYIRPMLEHCCSVCGPQTQNSVYMAVELENVQKRATKIILGSSFSNYESDLELLNSPTLFDRRHELIM